MRGVLHWAACAAAALSFAGCDPIADRRYATEGAGVDLYTSDSARQIYLLNQYISFVCEQSGPSCGSSWTTFVQAGMNDIDLRCDGFLTWMDARRRDREPVIAEISAINAAVHSIMTVTGSSPTSLDIVTAAFGLASATYANWNSRLLFSINQSTVQEIVYKSQGQYREKIKGWDISDQPTAIYVLRNYLRLCMPTTIEASINTIATLVQRDRPAEAQKNLVVTNTAPPRIVMRSQFRPDDSSALLEQYLDPDGTGTRNPDRVQKIIPFLERNGLRRRDLTRFLNGAEFAARRQKLVQELGLR
jgi:hypothetical protein